jgi:hypothetical protein
MTFAMLKNIFNLTLLLSLSTVLAYLLAQNQATITEFWQYISNTSESETPQVVEKIQTPVAHKNTANILPAVPPSTNATPVITLVDNRQVADESRVESNDEDFKCTSLPLADITVKKQDAVLRWTDANGKIHFGDAAPHQVSAQHVRLKRKKELEYFNLSMSGDELPTRFNERLSTRITRIYQLLSELIPADKLEKVTVDLKMFNHRKDYSRYSNQIRSTPGTNSVGFYTMRYNQAVVYRRNDHQGGEVALHESTHVINAGIFGYTPRWLNEGLAEYMENMTLSAQMAEISPNKNWTKYSRINYQLVGFNELFATKNRQWGGSKRRSYYATSWALIYFLMSSPEDRQWLGELLTAKARQRCERMITRQYVDKAYPGGIANLQKRFNHWIKLAALPTHRY